MCGVGEFGVFDLYVTHDDSIHCLSNLFDFKASITLYDVNMNYFFFMKVDFNID